MKNRTMAATVGVVAFVGLAAVAPATAGSSSAVSLEEMLPILAKAQSSSDHVPDSIDLDALGNISEDTIRFLGSDHAGSYWVGTTASDDVCLVMQTAADPDMAASSCVPIGSFYRDGLRLMAGQGMDQPETNAEAYLFPSDINLPSSDSPVSSARSAGGSGDSASFISGAAGELDDLDAFEVSRDDGTTFHFAPISREGL